MGSFRPTLMIVLLAAVALAGCSEEPGPVAEPGQTAEPPKVEATSTTGGIRGVVVDPAIVPIQGATVKVLNSDKTATTAADGSFAISGLEAGTYFLQASHPLHEGAQTSADVKAGVANPPAIKIVLNKRFSSDPYMETQQFAGYIVCSTNIQFVGYSEECGEGVGLPGSGERVGRNPNSHPQIWFRVTSNNVSTFVVEQVWEPSLSVATGNTEAFWTRLGWDWFCTPFCGGTTFGTVTSESPLLLRVDEERIRSVEESKGPVTPDSDLSTFVYSGAENGVILEQPYEQFVSIFYLLPAPEGWSFVNGDRNPYAG